MELYPFSFKEFLAFHKVPYGSGPRLLSDGRAAIRRSFKQYLVGGGFPESVAGGADEELRQLYQDMIMKDLIVRFGIRDVRSFRELALYLVSNVGVAISFNNLKKMLGFKSVTTVKNYVDFFEQSYLLFSIFKYDYSLKKQIMNNRKIFSIDTGLSIAVSFSFSDNRGRLLENLVFLELKRRQSEVYYYSDGRTECDFAIQEGTRISAVLQVTESLDKGNREREVAGLIAAARAYSLSEGVIVTLDQEEDFMFDEIKVRVVPAWKWLLE
jgi:predicted AAA+ superfamily ATPase